MVQMITIKFPKKPLTTARKRAMQLGKKYVTREDEFIFEIDTTNITDTKEVLDIFGGCSSGLQVFFNGEEVESSYLLDLAECIKNKKPFTNLAWFEHRLSKFGIIEDFKDYKENLDRLSIKKSYEVSDESVDWMTRYGFIESIKFKSEYLVRKDKLREFFQNKLNLIKWAYPEYSELEIVKIIDEMPEKILLDDKEEEIEGEEYIDWYSPVNFCRDVLGLLKKIEENTRK